jgi:2-methylcitrate dehydratase PrpD
VGSVLRLSPEQMHSAFGLALMQAAGSMQIVLEGDPPAKAVYGAFSNQGGFLSATLAKANLHAAIDAFDGQAGLFARHYRPLEGHDLTADLGRRFVFQNVSFKPWPSSGITHPFIEAAQKIGVLDHESIEQVVLVGGTRTRVWFEPDQARRYPKTTSAAANSIYFTVERMLTNGSLGLADFTPAALAETAPIRALMQHSIDPALGTGALVQIRYKNGQTRSERVEAPLGNPLHPMSDEQLRNKFIACAAHAKQPVSDPGKLFDLILHCEEMPDIGRAFDL